jgi:RNA polymerase sigma-70 factor (ECF subfamily)
VEGGATGAPAGGGPAILDVLEARLNEEVWIRKARAGDEQAFRRLVERHAPVIWTVVNRMTSDPALSEDLFQETVIRFWKGLPSFQGASKLSTWLYRIAYHVCLDGLKAAERRGEESLQQRTEESGLEPEDEARSGEGIARDLETDDALQRGLARIQPEWRTMILLYYWRGLSIEEIAEVTERPANTVKVYLHRARAALRKELERSGYPEKV